MRIFKVVDFDDWAKENQITDKSLLLVIEEIIDGLVDANLGGGILKKESLLKDVVKEAVQGLSWHSELMRGQFLFTVLQRIKNRI